MGLLHRLRLDGRCRWSGPWSLGQWVLSPPSSGLALAWVYSAPPIRLKQNGWWGNSAVGLAYEGLPWFTGAAVIAASLPDAGSLRSRSCTASARTGS